MTEREALLRAVCANPDDDLPRLVFADWLEEHGEAERAEYIRLQCELALLHQLPRCVGENDERRRVLVARELDLEADHEERWRAELPHSPDPAAVRYRWLGFRRGFVTWLEVEGEAATAIEWAVLHSAAPLQCLFLKGLVSVRDALTASEVGRWREVRIERCPIDWPDVDALVSLTTSPRFEHLIMKGCDFEPGTEVELSRHFGRRFIRWTI